MTNDIHEILPLDTKAVSNKSGNIYRSITIASKRANQITLDVKEELTRKLAEFAPAFDNLDEVMENKEQIEISKHYERKAKPQHVALVEFMNDEIYYRDPNEGNL